MAMYQCIHTCRFNNEFIGFYKYVVRVRSNWLCLSSLHIQTSAYTRKSAEEKLGIEKPKQPLNPFFKFMQQMRPALLAKIPGMSTREAVVWSSKHWQQVDRKTKLDLGKEYKRDIQEYKQIKAKYEASLTEQQKEDIKRTNIEMKVAQENEKLKKELKEMGKPKKPLSSYLLYALTRKDLFQSQNLKEYQQKIKLNWLNLSKEEREQFEKQAQDLMKKYKKDMDEWELKMISIGRPHLVRRNRKPIKQKQIKREDVNKR